MRDTSSVIEVLQIALMGLLRVSRKSSSATAESSEEPVITTRMLSFASSSQSFAKFSIGHCLVGQRSDDPGLMPMSVWLGETHCEDRKLLTFLSSSSSVQSSSRLSKTSN